MITEIVQTIQDEHDDAKTAYEKYSEEASWQPDGAAMVYANNAKVKLDTLKWVLALIGSKMNIGVEI